jgi:hypothetical protein
MYKIVFLTIKTFKPVGGTRQYSELVLRQSIEAIQNRQLEVF